MTGFARFAGLVLSIWLAGTQLASAQLLLTEDEIAATLSHGPWPPEITADPSNRMSGNVAAIALGEALFFDPSLSRDGDFSCASCHNPALGFSDGLPHSMGRVQLDRNAPSLWNLRWNRWFGWSGASDSLWSHSVLPLTHPDEMAHDAESLKNALSASPHARSYARLFGAIETQDPVQTMINISKALAAFQETLVTGQTSFDRFRDALEAGDLASASTYPAAAQRGLKLFVGRGNCSFCHLGPLFSNGEFHDAGVPYFIDKTRVDAGRFGGLQILLSSPFTLDGEYSDDPTKAGAWAVNQVKPLHSDFGIFRVPGLRNVARTAPYMHNGSLTDLTAVVQHYNTINLERMHTDGEAILAPLGLSDSEVVDIVAFLNSLTEEP